MDLAYGELCLSLALCESGIGRVYWSFRVTDASICAHATWTSTAADLDLDSDMRVNFLNLA